MKKILVIGAGYAGRTISLRLKEHAAVTVIDHKEQLLVKEKFFPWLAKKATDKEVLLNPEKFFAQQGIPFAHAKVEKIYPLKKEIGLDNKERLSYECLIVAAGSVSLRKESLAGEAKQGVCYLAHIEPQTIRETFLDAVYMVVEANTLFGLVTAVLLKRHHPQKEVKLFIKDAYLREVFLKHFRDERLDVCAEEIAECIGEGSVRAIRLNTGKVFAADMVFLDTGLVPNTKLFESYGFFKFEENAFAVDASLKTTLEDIFALGDVANRSLKADRLLFRTTAHIDSQIERLTEFIVHGSCASEEPGSDVQNEEEMLQGIKTRVLA